MYNVTLSHHLDKPQVQLGGSTACIVQPLAQLMIHRVHDYLATTTDRRSSHCMMCVRVCVLYLLLLHVVMSV
jgi:hypothetical protein